MEPIISPWLFYLLEIVSNFQIVLVGVSAIIFFVYGFINISSFIEDEEPKINKKRKKLLIRYVAFPCLILGILTPSKDTIIKMVIAKHVTADSVNTILEIGGDFKNELKRDIFELIEKFQNKEKENREQK